MSSQFAVESALGEGKGARIVVDGTYDPENDRYLNFNEQLVVDAMEAGLAQAAAEKLAERIRRHVDKGCTVKHTYEIETPVRMDVDIRH